jgi:hypothetical protein
MSDSKSIRNINRKAVPGIRRLDPQGLTINNMRHSNNKKETLRSAQGDIPCACHSESLLIGHSKRSEESLWNTFFADNSGHLGLPGPAPFPSLIVERRSSET